MERSSPSSGSVLADLVLKVDGEPEEYFLQHGMCLGRAVSNTICIDDPRVEHIHARVLRRAEDGLCLRSESATAKIFRPDGGMADEVVLDDGVRFVIGGKTLICVSMPKKSRPDVVVTDNPWRIQCPVCHGDLSSVPAGTADCPSCGASLLYRGSGDDNGFEGWLPRKVGPYRIRAFVGQGGMGVILRGLHETTDMPAAVKLLRLGDDPTLAKRFLMETETLRSLSHPNVVTLQDHGQDRRMIWLAMDWVQGESLAAYQGKRRAKKEPIDIAEAAEILTQIAGGLEYLHGRGIVHRDLKPQNILRAEDHLIKIVDFGLAVGDGRPGSQSTMLTRTGMVAGTLGYMSPEQMGGGPVTAASDMYSFGLIMHELLTGKRPMGVLQPLSANRRDCPPTWQALAQSCLDDDPWKRPGASRVSLTLRNNRPAGFDLVPGFSRPATGKVSPQAPAVKIAPPTEKAAAALTESLPAATRKAPSTPKPAPPVSKPYQGSRFSKSKRGSAKWLVAGILLALVGAGVFCSVLLFPDLGGRMGKAWREITAPSGTSEAMPASFAEKPSDAPTAEREHQPAPARQASNDSGEARAATTRKPEISGSLRLELGGGITADCVLVKAGSFLMGSSDGEAMRGVDEKRHEVRITRSFYIASREVTQEQYAQLVGNNPSTFKGGKRPVENVTWNDAVNFCRLLSERTRRKVRLPTEAEWEYACRAGRSTPFNTGNTLAFAQANIDASAPYGDVPAGQKRSRTTEVAAFPPNAWGLYDMHGNVQEWCADWYGAYENTVTRDPTGPKSGEQRVLRGGGWRHSPDKARSAGRASSPPDGSGRHIGFRFVVEL